MAPTSEITATKRRDDRVLAIAGGDEIGRRNDLFRLGKLDDPPDHRHAEREHQDRADIDAGKFQPALGGEPDAAEIGPGGAINRKAQRIDQRPALDGCKPTRPTVAESLQLQTAKPDSRRRTRKRPSLAACFIPSYATAPPQRFSDNRAKRDFFKLGLRMSPTLTLPQRWWFVTWRKQRVLMWRPQLRKGSPNRGVLGPFGLIFLCYFDTLRCPKWGPAIQA